MMKYTILLLMIVSAWGGEAQSQCLSDTITADVAPVRGVPHRANSVGADDMEWDNDDDEGGSSSQSVTISDVTALIDRYLAGIDSVTIADITDLIDKYLTQ